MASLIPPIGTRGLYELKAPWSTVPNTIYECAAIRYFVDLENLGVNILEAYYTPMGLEQANVDTDRRADVAVLTLVSDTSAPIYVPSSHVAAFPNLTQRNYKHLVLSASLGPIPDYIDLTFLQSEMASLVSDTIGLEPTVALSAAPLSESVSPTQHEILEAARQAAIDNRTTPRARVLDLQKTKSQLEQRLAIMEQILRDHGLLPD